MLGPISGLFAGARHTADEFLGYNPFCDVKYTANAAVSHTNFQSDQPKNFPESAPMYSHLPTMHVT